MTNPHPGGDLHRQVHPSHVQADGKPMSLAFKPSAKDGGYLSTREDGCMSAEVAHSFHTNAGYESCGTWSFASAQAAPLPIIHDGSEDNPCHVSVDFNGELPNSWRAHAKRLISASRKTFSPGS